MRPYFRKMPASARRSKFRKLVVEIYRKKPAAEKEIKLKKKQGKISNLRARVFLLQKIQRVNAYVVKKKLVGKIATEASSLEDVSTNDKKKEEKETLLFDIREEWRRITIKSAKPNQQKQTGIFSTYFVLIHTTNNNFVLPATSKRKK